MEDSSLNLSGPDSQAAATVSNKRSRVILGCQGCRVRHVKCDAGVPTCSQCETIGIQCERSLNIRFRYQPGPVNDPDCGFPASQVWLEPTMSLQYRDETSEIAKFYELHSHEATAPSGTLINYGSSKEGPVEILDPSNGLQSHIEPQYTQPEDSDMVESGFFETQPVARSTVRVSPHSQASINSQSRKCTYLPYTTPQINAAKIYGTIALCRHGR